MALLAQVLVAVVALLHICFLVLEMFLWTVPVGLRVFGQSRDAAEASKVLAANQGLYNGFLAAGLIWALVAENNSHDLSVFFLSCVIVAGIYGAITASRMIIVVQAMPAALALACVLLSAGA